MKYRYRLKSSLVAVYRENNGKGTAEVVPEGELITSSDSRLFDPATDKLKLIDVEWQGRSVGVFLIDLLQRAEPAGHANG